MARVYILRGLQVTSIKDKESPKTYLKYIFNGKETVDKDSTRQGLYPEYYRSEEFPLSLPGTAVLRIEIWEKELVGFD